MSGERMQTLHIHLGPHKTGSTAIQQAFASNHDFWEEHCDFSFEGHRNIRDLAVCINNNDLDQAFAIASRLELEFRKVRHDILISCEDFSGDLPGRTSKRRPYPQLLRNVQILKRVFPSFRCRFYFFVRDPQAWKWSAYTQLLKYRQKYSDYESYQNFLKSEELWDGVLTKVREKIGAALVEIPYLEGEAFSSVSALLVAMEKSPLSSHNLLNQHRSNASPSDREVDVLELINRSSASNHAKRNAKRMIISGRDEEVVFSESMRFPDWPPNIMKPRWLARELDSLWERTEWRISAQDQPNLLPELDCDLTLHRTLTVRAGEDFPTGGRQEMSNQAEILRFRFRGMPELCFILGMCISYLRRDTEYTEHAAQLFQRLWREEAAVLLGTLPTRWLISTFQTFMDHGINEEQRLIGASAYFFSNTLKAYEAERALEGGEPDVTYKNVTPTTRSGFSGLDRFHLGGSDLLVNTNALLLEMASKDPVAGPVLHEFILRMKAAHTIFTRMDQSRISLKVNNPQFDNCWSFFEKPGNA